jgi:hypothetical protein
MITLEKSGRKIFCWKVAIWWINCLEVIARVDMVHSWGAYNMQ